MKTGFSLRFVCFKNSERLTSGIHNKVAREIYAESRSFQRAAGREIKESKNKLSEAWKGWINLNKYKVRVYLYKSWKVVGRRRGEILTLLSKDELSRNLSCINPQQILSKHHPFKFPSILVEALKKCQSVLIAFASGREFLTFMLPSRQLRRLLYREIISECSSTLSTH